MQPLSSLDLKDAVEICQLNDDEFNELVEYGVVELMVNESGAVSIASSCIHTLQTAAQIRIDYALDLFSIVILVNYLQRITDLENENLLLKSELSKCFR